MENRRYPIGKYIVPKEITREHIDQWITEIESFPARLKEKVAEASQDDLNTPYREGGWTIRQVVNHVADSHINSFSRFKLALTEENPTIRPYFEGLWADMPDSKDTPIEWSLNIIEGIHGRWVYLLNNMTEEDWEKTFFHPEHKSNMALDVACGMYAWHSNHHLGHVGLVL